MSYYRVEFSITRRQDGDDDFTEIGFGSSGAWTNVAAAAHDVASILDNGDWETTPGMPDPRSISHGGGPDER